jgi:sporulation protein YlmC with PRC-barrel domain
MLTNVKKLTGYKLQSLNGEIGAVKEFYFDDRYWTIRYLVASTGSWLSGKQVLISPYSLDEVLENNQDISVNLTREQIEKSPDIDSDKPVSRQFEESYFGFYGWPGYWTGPYMWGMNPYINRDPLSWQEDQEAKRAWDQDLRSTKAVEGYHIRGIDGEVGHVEDYIVDDQTWTIRYLVVKTSNWWLGKLILLSTDWVEHVSWDESTIDVTLTQAAIKASPEYDPDLPIGREFEHSLHHHYGRKGYWVDKPIPTALML